MIYYRSAVRLLPDNIPQGVHFQDPGVGAGKNAITLRSPAASVACYYEPTVRGQLYRMCLINVGSAAGFLPYYTARGINLENQGVPVVDVAETALLPTARNYESTITCLLHRTCSIRAVSTVRLLPYNIPQRVQLDDPSMRVSWHTG